MASSRRHLNRITSLKNGEICLEGREEIVEHIVDYFEGLHQKEDLERPLLDNLDFNNIGEERAKWSEREFEKEEVRLTVFSVAGDKAPGPDGFPMAFFQCFWGMLKEDVMAFMREFHTRGRLSKGLVASFVTLIRKKSGADKVRDFRPISLIGSAYKILAKLLANRLRQVLQSIISLTQGAFVMGRQILDGMVIANDCVHSRHKRKLLGVLCKLRL